MLHSALSIPPHPMRTLNTARLRLLCQERHRTDRSDVAPLAVASHFTAEDPRRVEGPSPRVRRPPPRSATAALRRHQPSGPRKRQPFVDGLPKGSCPTLCYCSRSVPNGSAAPTADAELCGDTGLTAVVRARATLPPRHLRSRTGRRSDSEG